LKKAGSANDIINRQALDDIYAYSNGIPRMINNICDMSLMAGFISNTKVIDSKIVKEAVQDLS
jgi:general secretion pathway protein A